jgi:hypothetical protein
MSIAITTVGLFTLLSIFLVFFIRKPKLFIILTALLMPIHALYAMELGSTFIRPFLLATILFILYFYQKYGVQNSNRFYYSLLFVITVVLIYVATPIFDINSQVFDIRSSVSSVDSLYLSNFQNYSNPFQLAYLIYWFAFILIFSTFLNREKLQLFFYKAMVLSMYPVLVIGIFYIFNSTNYSEFSISNSIGSTSEVYFLNWGVGFLGIPRMFSLPGEPANIALFLGIILGPIIQTIYTKSPIFFRHKSYEYFLLFLLIFSIILTQSTTGLLLLLLLLLLSMVINFNTSLRYFIVAISLLILLIMILGGINFQILFEKLIDHSGSGMVRYIVNTHVLSIIKDNFLFGIGWGNTRSLAFNLYIFSGSGITGFSVFLLVVYSFLKKYSNEFIPLYLVHLRKGLSNIIIAILFLGFFAVSESIFVMPFFWVSLSILSSCYYKKNGSR